MFKCQVVEGLLSGASTPTQLMRCYEISSGLLYHWKKQYATGRFDNPSNKEAALEERVRQLEQLVSRLTLEIETIIEEFPGHGYLRVTRELHRVYPNLVCHPAVTRPNQVWVADITYTAFAASIASITANIKGPFHHQKDFSLPGWEGV